METQTKRVSDEVADLLAKGEDLIAQAETLLIENNGENIRLTNGSPPLNTSGG